jgi:DTW domain-containing protein YfiP
MLPKPWLLFPGDDSTASESSVHEGQPGTLVVLDGTWRKCKRMLMQSPWLQSLPRMELSQLPPARNFLRKSSQPDGVSTLEAVVYALELLESRPDKYASLINALDVMLEQFQTHIPDSLLKAYYGR